MAIQENRKQPNVGTMAMERVRKNHHDNLKRVSEKYGYDLRNKDSPNPENAKLRIEVKGTTPSKNLPDEEKDWFHLSRLANKGLELAKNSQNKEYTYQLHIVQFSSKDCLHGKEYKVPAEIVPVLFWKKYIAWEADERDGKSIKDQIEDWVKTGRIICNSF